MNGSGFSSWLKNPRYFSIVFRTSFPHVFHNCWSLWKQMRLIWWMALDGHGSVHGRWLGTGTASAVNVGPSMSLGSVRQSCEPCLFMFISLEWNIRNNMADWLIIYNYNIYIYIHIHAWMHTYIQTERQTERHRQTDRHTYWVNYNDITATEPWNHG